MKLLTMPPGKPVCMIYAYAMLMDKHPQDVINALGHDGLDVWFAGAIGNKRYRGIIMQDLQDLANDEGYLLAPISEYPAVQNDPHIEGIMIHEPHVCEARIRRYLNNTKGILRTINNRGTHAMAWDGVQAYDPRGYILRLHDLKDQIHDYWILTSKISNR